jgi:hypothetical protein
MLAVLNLVVALTVALMVTTTALSLWRSSRLWERFLEERYR